MTIAVTVAHLAGKALNLTNLDALQGSWESAGVGWHAGYGEDLAVSVACLAVFGGAARWPGGLMRRPITGGWTACTRLRRVDNAQVLSLARSLMDAHGLSDWQVGLDRARRRAGLTNFTRRTITLSRYLMPLYCEDDVRETILHEIAHALVGPGHHHDDVWAAQARRIGASGRRTVPAQAPRIEGPWVGTCPAGHSISRMRRPTRPASCAQCSRRFDPKHLLSWSVDGVPIGDLFS